MGKRNLILFVLGIGISLMLAAWFVFFVLRNNKPQSVPKVTDNLANNNVQQQDTDYKRAYPFTEDKKERSQEEIKAEYVKRMNDVLNDVKLTQAGADDILAETESAFFDIFVPNDKMDLHLQTLLKIQKIRQEKDYESVDGLRMELIPLIEELIK